MYLELGAIAVFAAIYLLLRRGQRISGDRARDIVGEGAKLVDVRTPEEFDDGHIEGAVNIPVAELADRFADVGDKAKPVVVYCRSGARSARAKQMLLHEGFSEVHDLGGMGRW